MKSFLQIPMRYEVMVISGGRIRVSCTDHPQGVILRDADGGLVGVDEIVRLVEEHEKMFH